MPYSVQLNKEDASHESLSIEHIVSRKKEGDDSVWGERIFWHLGHMLETSVARGFE